jgi:hypothetical protein
LSRLITTFDEVPPYISPTIHIADDDGVTFSKRVPPKSFVQPRKLKTEVFKYSRLARTPPSTFLFLHLHLSNSPGSKPLPTIRRDICNLIRRQITTDFLSVVDSLIIMRSFRGAVARRGRGPKQRRAQWPGYRPAQSGLSTPIVNKTSHRAEFLRRDSRR